MRIITFRFHGTDETITATIDGRTIKEADANAIRIFAEGNRSVFYEIGRTARAGEAKSLPNILDAISNA